MTRASFTRQPLEKVVSRYDRVARWYRFGEWTILLAPGFRRRAVARIGLIRASGSLKSVAAPAATWRSCATRSEAPAT